MGVKKELHCLLLFLQLLQQSVCEVHSISAYFIGSEGLDLPEYMETIAVDDVTMFYYDSTMKEEVPCPEWLSTTAGRQHWKEINVISHHNKHSMKTALESAVLQFNRTASRSNIYQGYSRCDLHPNGSIRALLTHAFNGKDFLTLDIDRKTFVASVPQAVVYKRLREDNPVVLEVTVSFYKRVCFERLKMFLQHNPEGLRKKVPEVRIFERTQAGSSVLTCHVTGFYPREVRVEWVGPGLRPVGGDLIGVLPNGDGTFQSRRSVIRPEENPERHTYSCVVHHSSVPGNVTSTWVAGTRTGLVVWISLACSGSVLTGAGLLLRWFYKTRTKDAGI